MQVNKSGIITNIQRFSVDDGPGIRTTVFLKGCNMDCIWCHNPETKNPLPQSQVIGGVACICGYEISPEDLIKLLIRDKPFYDRSCGGVTFSGGEPMLQTDFLSECLRLCKEEKLHTAVDTAGNVPFSSFSEILAFTDLFLYDLKLADSALHKAYTGVPNERIIENLRLLHSYGDGSFDIIIRTVLLPGINDNREAFLSLAELLRDFPRVRRAEVLPYHAMGAGKYDAIGEKNRYPGKRAPDEEQAAYYQKILDGAFLPDGRDL